MKLFSSIFLFCLFFGLNKAQENQPDFLNPELPVESRIDDLISRLSLEEKASQMVNASEAIDRLGIPKYDWWNECLHGVARAGKATVFPQPIALGATFDPELIYRIGVAVSDEARASYNIAISKGYRDRYKGLTFWSPNVNIFRDARWGRGHETYGEDPFLSGTLGSAYVRGLQGDHPKYLKTAACAKHYAVHSGPEKDRHHFNAIVSDKDLFETYLPQFKMLVDAKVEIVMCAYNRTNDQPCCGSNILLNNILRNEWGFTGHIVTDCGALRDIHNAHDFTKNGAETSALAINSTVNLNCGSTYGKHLPEAVKQGLITEEQVNEAFRGLVRTRFKLGMFDPDNMVPYNKIPIEAIHSEKHQDLALEAATKSIVLLKNKDNALPLKKDLSKVFVTGPYAGNIDVLLGNYYGISDDMVTILEGVASKVAPGTSIAYKHGILFDKPNVNPLDWSTSHAANSDATIAVIGISPLLEGEEGESIASPEKGDRAEIMLPQHQIDYVKKLREQGKDKKLILVITGGSPVAIPELHDLADAILFVWYPGEKGGQAAADIIFGDASPSGRLPISFPKSLTQVPDYADYSMENRTYKYMKEDPLYPFGFGLTYSSFEYSGMKLSKSKIRKGETIQATCKITNTGNAFAREIAQLYVTVEGLSYRAPKFSIKGIKHVELWPGQSKEVSFEITPDMMASINMQGESMIEKGNLKITIAGSSPGARSIELGAAKPAEATIAIK